MFFFGKLFKLFFLGFLILGILGFFGRGGHGRYQSAYQQGFIDGQQSAATSKAAVPDGVEGPVPVVPERNPGANIYYHGHGFFFPGFGLFFCLIPLFFLGMFFMGFGRRRWHGHHHHRGNWGPYGSGRGPWGYGPCGHGKDEGGRTKEKSPDDIDDGSDEPIFHA